MFISLKARNSAQPENQENHNELNATLKLKLLTEERLDDVAEHSDLKGFKVGEEARNLEIFSRRDFWIVTEERERIDSFSAFLA
jgi:hypothetical protein